MFLYKIIFSCLLKNNPDSVAADSLFRLRNRHCCRDRLSQQFHEENNCDELGNSNQQTNLCRCSHNYSHCSSDHCNSDRINTTDTYHLVERIYLCEKCSSNDNDPNRRRKFGNNHEKWKISLSSDALNDLESCCFDSEKLWLTSPTETVQTNTEAMYSKLPMKTSIPATDARDDGNREDDFILNSAIINNNRNVSVVHVGSTSNLSETSCANFYEKKSLRRHQSSLESNNSKKTINKTTCRWLNGKQDINQRPDCLNLLSKNVQSPILSPPVQFKDKKCYSQLYQRYLVRKSISGYNYYNYYYVKHSNSLDDKKYCCDRNFLTSNSTLYFDDGSDLVENPNFPRSPSPILNKRKLSRDASYSRIPFRERLNNELLKEANLVLNYCSKNSMNDDENLPNFNHCFSINNSLSTSLSSSSTSSSNDVWYSTRDRSYSGSLNIKSSGLSSPQDNVNLFTNMAKQNDDLNSRPGSAPIVNDLNADFETNDEYQQQPRSMSLPQAFISTNEQSVNDNKDKLTCRHSCMYNHHCYQQQQHTNHYLIQHYQQKFRQRNSINRDEIKKISNINRQRINFKSSSSPQLFYYTEDELDRYFDQNGKFEAESLFKKFQKSFSLRFQKHNRSISSNNQNNSNSTNQSLLENSQKISSDNASGASSSESKYKFGPLIWRTSKERKKRNRALRNAKCNSGDSGIQLEMISTNGYENDTLSDGFDDSPIVSRKLDLINRVLSDKCKTDAENQKRCQHYVRRTNSDISSHRFLLESRNYNITKNRMHNSSEDSSNSQPISGDDNIQCRHNNNNNKSFPQAYQRSSSYLRRSLSQPIDIDKLLVYSSPKGGKEISNSPKDFSDEDNSTDSDSSIVSLSNERKKSLDMVMDEDNVPILAEALFDHIAIENDELGFKAGDVIEVVEMVNKDWWWGSSNNRDGWFPSASVRLKVNQEETVEDCIAAMRSGKQSSTKLNRRTSISLLSNDQVRSSVVRELIQTERDFVKILTDLVEGYLNECRLRSELFNNEDLSIIFGNIEDILQFQTNFLNDLESCIDWNHLNHSCIGRCFLDHHSGFLIYSDYCNRHPMASVKLQEFFQYKIYCDFFENCRISRNLSEIPLNGYLLTPIQRICKYPLQLAELLKYTKTDHKDYSYLKDALNMMKDVATMINERKRRFESLQKLIVWQNQVDYWEGEDLIESSTQLIHQGEVFRVTSGMWTNSVTLFLFDHQIVYCRKDMLKRNTYIYKGRICLDTSEVIDVPNGKDVKLGVNVRHGLKVYCYARDKWLLFCCRSANDKQRWLDALKKERELIKNDELNGFKVSNATKNLAKMAAFLLEDRPPLSSKYRDLRSSNIHLTNNNTSYSFGRKVGNWLTFGNNKRSRH